MPARPTSSSGHSERRTLHGETDAAVRAKAEAARRAGLSAVICVGETRGEREAGDTLAVIRRQVRGSLPDGAGAGSVVVAYEPVWAIGTGLTPTAADVAEVHALIRDELGSIVGRGDAERTRILYGGSVKPANAGELLSVANVGRRAGRRREPRRRGFSGDRNGLRGRDRERVLTLSLGGRRLRRTLGPLRALARSHHLCYTPTRRSKALRPGDLIRWRPGRPRLPPCRPCSSSSTSLSCSRSLAWCCCSARKAEAWASAGEGAGVSGFMTGRGQANALTKATAILAGLFFLTSIVLAAMATYQRAPSSILDRAPPPASAPAGDPAPAPGGGGTFLDQLRRQQGDAPRRRRRPGRARPRRLPPPRPSSSGHGGFPTEKGRLAGPFRCGWPRPCGTDDAPSAFAIRLRCARGRAP